MNHDALNLKAYSNSRIVSAFSHDHALQKAEEIILSKIAQHVRGGEILDVGVGCGRTTPALLTISERYTGIDYAEGMLAVCKARFPQQRFLMMDARKMEVFESGRFDLVFFSFNGLDNVGHTDRLTIISRIYEILKPGGYFVFSSHNRDFSQFESFLKRRPRVTISNNPIATLKNLSKLPVQYCRYVRNSRKNVIETDYAVVNEPAGDYQMLQYYISIESQTRQLQSLGFDRQVEAYDFKGQIVEQDQDSGWIYYLSKKR
ncbi:putative S-adenosylmethionine-dependent methyltransferase/MSMEI_2290 [Caballeronia terrestris]|uniref:S-adenosylmethionine-dependent methyltransferase/MSMEI_2290 n=1 Tax=Caballeronia terrestris TaxID=1226301 RepID=A0A158KMM6_9BURK|nr:class I SAM-dependent methyltransferase [Caballeronia terrestris]SAL82372.1 putative S-adenosylmethionine-dependent methyltransferase/MSMEI_2290 [Caballeronia terrestris]